MSAATTILSSNNISNLQTPVDFIVNGNDLLETQEILEGDPDIEEYHIHHIQTIFLNP